MRHMPIPPNYRPCEKFVIGPCCQNCMYLRSYDIMYACIKHLCYVERSKLCDDYEDGRDYRFGLEFRPTTRKEYELLKLALKHVKAPESSSQLYPASKFDNKTESGGQ